MGDYEGKSDVLEWCDNCDTYYEVDSEVEHECDPDVEDLDDEG